MSARGSRAGEDHGVLANVLHKMFADCRFCGCKGESCTTATGEKCDLIGNAGRCTGVACMHRWNEEQKREKWARRREQKKRGRAA